MEAEIEFCVKSRHDRNKYFSQKKGILQYVQVSGVGGWKGIPGNILIYNKCKGRK